GFHEDVIGTEVSTRTLLGQRFPRGRYWDRGFHEDVTGTEVSTRTLLGQRFPRGRYWDR
ncbi:hypothetical protein ACJMK2_006291, partial [Sinanodonta woodiana]